MDFILRVMQYIYANPLLEVVILVSSVLLMIWFFLFLIAFSLGTGWFASKKLFE